MLIKEEINKFVEPILKFILNISIDIRQLYLFL